MKPERGDGACLDAIEEIYRARFERFATVAVAIVGSQAAARDAVQDAFALAVRRCSQFRGDGALEGWLWRLVVNEARSQRRRTALRERVEQAARADEPWTVELVDDGQDGTLAALVAALPERQRLVVFLRYYGDLSYEQIAGTLGVRPGTVAATLSAAHGALRSQLEQVAL